MLALIPIYAARPSDEPPEESPEDRRNRLGVAGILMDLLGYEAFASLRIAAAATPWQRKQITAAADNPDREQAVRDVRQLVGQIPA